MTIKHTDSCPAWCADGQADLMQLAGDRMHLLLAPAQPLLTMPFENEGPPDEPQWVPPCLLVELDQHVREVEARVVIGTTLPRGQSGDLYLTLDEAERHARLVLELVRAARTNTPVDYTNVTSQEEQ